MCLGGNAIVWIMFRTNVLYKSMDISIAKMIDMYEA